MMNPGKVILFLIAIAICGSPSHAQPYATGHISSTLIDTVRNNRSIPVEVYYPAVVQGDDVPVAPGSFPVIAFGHGFVMSVTSYNNFRDSLVPGGYILILPATETGISPSHSDLAADMVVAVQSFNAYNHDTSSPFYSHVSSASAFMGHSMGGGAAFLAAAAYPSISAMVTFAAANTSPSAIAAATQVGVPCLLFAGSHDCVTPPAQHQQPMYDSLSSACKSLVTITGGGHCYFADYNFLCTLGENSCSPNPTIDRNAQQDATFDLLMPWLDHVLKGGSGSWAIFTDSLQNSMRFTYDHYCPQAVLPDVNAVKHQCRVYPVPFGAYFDVSCPGKIDSIELMDVSGRVLHRITGSLTSPARCSVTSLKSGIYFIRLMDEWGHNEFHCVVKGDL